MKAQYYSNGFGVSLYTDFPLYESDADERFRYFLSDIEELSGVDSVVNKRYSMEITFGILFDPIKVLNSITNSFKACYGVSEITEVDVMQIAEKGVNQLLLDGTYKSLI